MSNENLKTDQGNSSTERGPGSVANKDAGGSVPNPGAKTVPSTNASNPAEIRKEKPDPKTQSAKTPQGEGEGDCKIAAPHQRD